MADFRPVDLPFVRANTLAMLVDIGPDIYRWAVESGEQRLTPDVPPAEQVDILVNHEMARLNLSELFYVSADMVSLAKSAGLSLPSFALTPEDLPSPAGFVVFEEPIDEFSNTDDRDPNRLGRMQIRAACWGPCWGAEVPSLWITWYVDAHTITESIGSFSVPYSLFLHNEMLINITGDEPRVEDYDGNTLDPVERSEHSHMAWFATLKTCWLLMSQTVSTVSDAHLDRATRRRLARADISASRVRIITLRRRSNTQGSTEAARREFHHRWIVRGHWRNQPCGPGRSITRPVWIAPFLKGPDDGPILGGDKVHVLKR